MSYLFQWSYRPERSGELEVVAVGPMINNICTVVHATSTNDFELPALGAINLLGLASNLRDFAARYEADQRGFNGAGREAFLEGANYAVARFAVTIRANMARGQS